jgi:hypothetical protein
MGQVFQPKLKSGERSKLWAIRYYLNGRRVWERDLPSEAEAKRVLTARGPVGGGGAGAAAAG